MPEIYNWADIAGEYSGTLLLGNGASMAIDPCFSYGSLREAAAAEFLITPNIQKVFDHLETEDFELVMSMIWHAYHVNVALGIPESVTRQAYDEVKAALVGAVRRRHTTFETAQRHLDSIANFMKGFDTVLSLNYDLVVYWAMLEGNAQHGNWFKDCFVSGALDDEWHRMREPFRAEGATLVFYPHGNLALTTTLTSDERKVARGRETLLDQILAEWESGEHFPLFVSEGETRQKELAILRSPYLSTVYHEVFPSIGASCVTYGWSASDNDTHILRRLCRPGAARIAFSVFRGQRDATQIDLECSELELRVRRVNPAVKAHFYWSDSPGCWMNVSNDA